MKLGISSSCFYPLETEISFELLGKNGIKTAEIFFNAISELERPFVAELKKIREEYGITVTSIHPTLSLAESFMLFSGYERRYFEGIALYKRYAEIASELGARYIIMHGGKPNDVLDDLGYCERFNGIADAVKENGAVLLQENVAKHRAGNLDMLRLMKSVLGDNANFCLDIKQCIRGGYSPFDALEILGDRICHLHISDSNESSDCLLPLDGCFDLGAFFDKVQNYGYSGAAVIEVYKNAYTDRNEVFSAFSKLKQSDNKNILEI